MGKYGKWIGGALGWSILGPIGGLIGFGVGSLFDSVSIEEATHIKTTSRGDFAVSLLVLIASVLKADGKVLKSELDYVKSYLVRQFGSDSAGEAVLMLKDLLNQQIPVVDVCRQISQRMDYSSRLQLIHFLYGIAMADGDIHPLEIQEIDRISYELGISGADQKSIKSMFVKDKNAAYEILEISKDASADQIKKAYREMAKKYHPDKVNHLGEEMRKAAEEKFKKVNEAYETIKKEKGFN